jgi:hypothetical protein
MSGVFEFGAGPRGVRITPDGQFYAYSFYRDSGTLTIADVGKDWWKRGKQGNHGGSDGAPKEAFT